jgi:hypothetical protein
MSSVLAVAYCAFCVWSAAPSPSPRPDTLAVRVNVEFDRSIASNVIRDIVKDEASAIWSVYGVELLWADSDVGAALRLDAVITRQQAGPVVAHSHPVLGHATIDDSGVVRGPIHIWFDTIDSLLRRRESSNPALYDREFARALGRVLAHELGHVLLGTCHDPDGLMRASFFGDDLARLDRRRFQLMDGSAGRLRAHITTLSEAQAGELDSCALISCASTRGAVPAPRPSQDGERPGSVLRR